MKKLTFFPAMLAMLLMASIPHDVAAQTLLNLAVKSTRVTASVNADNAKLIRDNHTGATNYWSSYAGEASLGQEAWVELQWGQHNQYTEVRTFWATQGEHIAVPTEAYVARWDGHEWHKVADLAQADEQGVSSTKVELSGTNKLRVWARSEQAAFGIRELRIFGYAGAACTPATLSDEKLTRVWDADDDLLLAPTLTLPQGVEENPIWNWTLPDGTTATTPTLTATMPGRYTVSYERECGAVTELEYNVFDPAVSYKWPAYNPTLNYDFRWEYPKLSAPTKGRLPEPMNVAREKHGEWWSVAVGSNANAAITDTSMVLLVKKMDEDFAFFRDEFGWPPDKRARNGYYSQIYGYGSGVGTDNEPNTALGGWQSGTTWRGEAWPMVLLSYYPIASFDPDCTYGDRIAQQNACVHEGIHATFADLEGCKQSAWFHEGGNTWLQGEAELVKSGKTPTSMGWLSAGNMIAPFMPIECYSGWLLDDSFGGPAAEGVNMYGSSGQICTWRRLLGGVQYGELFPHFLSEIMGRGSIPWIWRYCKGRVLEGMADSLGEDQMRHMIMEYRARQAMIDVGQWSNACRKLIDDNWLATIEQEWSPYWKKVEPWRATPYANMYRCDEVDSAGWWRPEWRTTPGWSGANQIPLHVSGNVGDVISLHFQPLGRNMRCMLCYRTKQGRLYYSQPVIGEGDVVMKLQGKPANNVVIAVVCNTDYRYEGEQTRKTHFDYRLRMGRNIIQPAKAQLKWYNYRSEIIDTDFVTGIETVPANDYVFVGTQFSVMPERTVLHRGESVPLHITGAAQLQVPVRLFTTGGQMVCSQSFMREGDFHVPSDVQPGLYIMQGVNGGETSSVKVVVK